MDDQQNGQNPISDPGQPQSTPMGDSHPAPEPAADPMGQPQPAAGSMNEPEVAPPPPATEEHGSDQGGQPGM